MLVQKNELHLRNNLEVAISNRVVKKALIEKVTLNKNLERGEEERAVEISGGRAFWILYEGL